MASLTMTASFLGAGGVTRKPSTTTRRGRGVFMASSAINTAETAVVKKEGGSGSRRDLVFAVAAAAAACSIAKAAMADEPGRGTLEAKKKYAPVCVTMPTARICRK